MNEYENAPLFQFSEEELLEVSINKTHMGFLELTSGKVVTCDPLVQPESDPLPLKLKPGRYSVDLYLDHTTVAIAAIKFSDGPVLKWRELDWAVNVNAGFACFMDKDGAEALIQHEKLVMAKMKKKYTSYYDDVFMELAPNDEDFFSYNPLPEIKANVFVFRSGYGDGSYPIWVGENAIGECLQIAMDFEVISDADARSDYEIEANKLAASLSAEEKAEIQKAYECLKNDDMDSFKKILDRGVVSTMTYIPGVGATLAFEAVRLNLPRMLQEIIWRNPSIVMQGFELYSENKTYYDYALSLKKKPHADILKMLSDRTYDLEIDRFDNADLINYDDRDLQRVNVQKVPFDELVLTSGSLVVCDPIAQPAHDPLGLKIKPGKYKVDMYLSDSIKALAALRLSEKKITYWIKLSFVSVDAGLVVFMDKDAALKINNQLTVPEEDYTSYQPSKTKANVLVFKALEDDVIYSVWGGKTSTGECAQVVIDFATVQNSDGRSEGEIIEEKLLANMSEEQKSQIDLAYHCLKTNDTEGLSNILAQGLITTETYISEVGATLTYESIRLNKPEMLKVMLDHKAPIEMPEWLIIDDYTTYLGFVQALERKPHASIIKMLEEKAKK